jgi:hypothetical protein
MKQEDKNLKQEKSPQSNTKHLLPKRLTPEELKNMPMKEVGEYFGKIMLANLSDPRSYGKKD